MRAATRIAWKRVPFEVPKERSKICFGGFCPLRRVEGHGLQPVGLFLRARKSKTITNVEVKPGAFARHEAVGLQTDHSISAVPPR